MEPDVDRPALERAAEAACRAGLRAGLREPDARDLAQEALVRALSTAPPPDGVPLAAWVYGIAKNLGRDHKKKAREVLVDVPETERAAPGTAIDDELTTVLAVRRALHALPEPLRDVVTLHELEDHSLRETAAALAIPFDTAKDRLRRGREQLRERLGDPGTAYGQERAHSRRRAATAAGAVVAAVLASLGEKRAAAATVATSGGVSAWIFGLAGTALVVGGFAAGRLTAPSPSPPPAVASVEPEPEPEPEPVLPSPAPVPPVVAPAPRAASTPHAARVASVSPPDAAPIEGKDHAAERLVLDRARAALQRGTTDEAIVTLMSHARQFPDGALAEERDVMLIEAYVRANNTDLAKRRIADYRAKYPTGALRARVDELGAAQ